MLLPNIDVVTTEPLGVFRYLPMNLQSTSFPFLKRLILLSNFTLISYNSNRVP